MASAPAFARLATQRLSRTVPFPPSFRSICSRNSSTRYASTTSFPRTTSRHNALLVQRRPSSSGQNRTVRTFSSTSSRSHGHIDPPKPGEERHVTFIDKSGQSTTFEVSDGSNLLDIAQANDLEMEGACGGSCACSTCHVVVEDPDMYDRMEEPDDDENDMLDLAFGLTETSRLGCQIKMSKELDGLVVRLPSMTRNVQGSDFAKK